MDKKSNISHILVLLLLSLPFLSHAQISVGLKGGLLINDFEKSPLAEGEPSPDPKAGFQVVVPVEIGIGDMFALQPEIMYGSHGGIQKGGGTGTALGLTSTTTFKFDYTVNTLEIPLLAKLRLGSDVLKFNVVAGPSVGFGLNGTQNTNSTLKIVASNGTVLTDQASSDKFNAKFLNDGYQTSELGAKEFAISKLNFNLHLGAGLGFDLGPFMIALDGRYMLGLSDLAPDPEGTAERDQVKVLSRRLGFSLGVMVPLN
jgi:hypothetical protein